MLEALLAELRIRRLEFDKKLVVLANRDYADFLRLAGASRGGGSRVNLKMGLLG